MDLEVSEPKAPILVSEIAFWISVLEPHRDNLQAQEDLMSAVKYTSVIDYWWRGRFAAKFQVDTSRVDYDNWKDLYKFRQATDISDIIRKATAADVKYLNILHQLNLLSRADSNLFVEDADYTLLQACIKDRHELVEFLVSTNAVVNPQVLLQGLYWGCVKKSELVVSALLKNSKLDQAVDNYSSYFEAVRQDSLSIVKLLVDAGANIRAQRFLGLKLAISLENIEIFEYLLEFMDPIDIDFDNGYLIRLACRKGNSEAVNILADKGADIDISEGEPVYIAAVNGYMNIVKDCIEIYGANPKLPRVLQAVYAVASQRNPERSTQLLNIIS